MNSADTIVVHALVKLVQGASLLGIQTMIVGISPQLAAVLVAEGLDSRRVDTMSDSRTAVLCALGQQASANGNGSKPHVGRSLIAML